MEGTAESDIPQCDNKALAADNICVDSNEQPNVDINVIYPILISKDSSPRKDITAEDACGKPEDELLFDLMVLDDDSLNQLPPLSKIAVELSLEVEDKLIKLESVDIVENPSDEIIKENVKTELEILNTEDVTNFENQDHTYHEFMKPIAKAPESDSLILTADDELETEMFLSEKDKNERSDKDDDIASIGLVSENKKITELKQIDGIDREVVCTDNSVLSTRSTNKKIAGIEHASCKTESKTAHTFGSRFLWVSNITHSIKATELKQFISKVGKVITAKIVTDGKKCYGYVVMDNFQDASECLKVLNNTVFEGRKITVSFTRPTTGNGDKNKESSIINDNDETKSKFNNGSDDSKSKDGRCIKSTLSKTRDSFKTRLGSIKKRRSRDSLTTKFESKNRYYRRRKSRSVERCSTDFLRDKLERDRLRRRILEERRRSRDEMVREMHREEKQRELEFKLERERRKLQFERELFERERRELYRLDVERRKIEKERLEVMQERSKLEKEFQKTRSLRKSDDFNLSSTIVKPQEPLKMFEKPKSKVLCDSNFRKVDNKHDRNDSNNAGPLAHRIGLKDDFKLSKENRERSKSRRGEDLKDYDRLIPPPPNLSHDFDLSIGRKLKHQDFKREVHGDRKIDHAGRKIEVIDRKYYSERSNENDRKNENVYRKTDFDDRKTYSFTERKYDYGRDLKRSRVGEFPVREPTIRNQWLPTTTYTEPWKTGLTTGVTNSPVRYQDGNFTTPSYSAANRVPPVYYHSGPSNQEYQRYDHCSQNNGRKY